MSAPTSQNHEWTRTPAGTSPPGSPGARAVDADPKNRPGVPMEKDPPEPAGHAHWSTPERQPDPGWVLRRPDLPELTPVFGTTVPPRGLSGLIRRAAYRIPEHHTTHWLALLFADRVDAIESSPLRGIVAPLAVTSGVLAAGLLLARRARR